MRRKSFHLTKKLNALGAQGLKLLVRALLQARLPKRNYYSQRN